MKEYFKDVRGWIALAMFVVALCALGFTKMLARHTNLTLLVIFVISVAIMTVLSLKRPEKNTDEQKDENASAQE